MTMEIKRRSFLGAILAFGAAPLVPLAEVPKLILPEPLSVDVVPPLRETILAGRGALFSIAFSVAQSATSLSSVSLTRGIAGPVLFDAWGAPGGFGLWSGYGGNEIVFTPEHPVIATIGANHEIEVSWMDLETGRAWRRRITPDSDTTWEDPSAHYARSREP